MSARDDFDLCMAIAASLDLDPGRPAVQVDGAWRTWGEVAVVARGVDDALAKAGVGRDESVALVLRNDPWGYGALLGLAASRRTVALVSPFQAEESVAADIGRLRPGAVVASARDWTPGLVEAAAAVPAVGLGLSETGAAPADPRLAARPSGVRAAETPGVAVHMLTSGATGAPKRIPLPRKGLSQAIFDQIRMAAAMGEAPASHAPEATLVQYGPMVQLSGLYNALQAGAEGRRLVMMEKFSPQTWIESVRTLRQHMLALPPAMMRMVLEAAPPREALASLKSVRSGAAPLDDDTRDRWEDLYGVPVLSIYGATEFVGPIVSWSLENHARFGVAKRGSVGRFWPDIAEGRVVAPETGEVLAPGESGVLEVRVGRAGPDWMRTNDLATLDADGFLFIHGRADDAINRGGFKIPPDVIATVLRRHPQVYDAAVVPLPDPRLGQVPGAAVELRKGEGPAPTEAELLAFARANLIAYQVPARLVIVPELPRTPAQKISRPGVLALFEPPPSPSGAGS